MNYLCYCLLLDIEGGGGVDFIKSNFFWGIAQNILFFGTTCFIFVDDTRKEKYFTRVLSKTMRFLFCLLLIGFSFYTVAQTTCPCTATTEKSRQHRTSAKHVTNYDDFVLKEDTVTTSYINKWQKKYKSKTDGITTTPGKITSERKHITPEDTLYIFKGFMWYVKQEKNDCDFHIEIGPKNVNRSRVIVEVPEENTELQKKIRDQLDALQLKIFNCNTHNTNIAHFDDPLPVIVIGLGFYDASHKPGDNHGDVHTNKYSWELHPVKDIIFL